MSDLHGSVPFFRGRKDLSWVSRRTFSERRNIQARHSPEKEEASMHLTDLLGVDIQTLETVEGDEILQALLKTSTPRRGQLFPQRRCYVFKDDEQDDSSLEQDEFSVASSSSCEAPSSDSESDLDILDNFQVDQHPSPWTMLRWVSLIAVFLSIFITWPVGLAYLVD